MRLVAGLGGSGFRYGFRFAHSCENEITLFLKKNLLNLFIIWEDSPSAKCSLLIGS
jgi:hypothetical protein